MSEETGAGSMQLDAPLSRLRRLGLGAFPWGRSTALAPLTLRGPLLLAVRVLWGLTAVGTLLAWAIEAPSYYNAALQLHNTNGMVNLTRAQWLAGLHALGLSPSAYALQSIFSLSLMAGCMYAAGVLIFLRRSNEWIAILVSLTFVTLGAGILGGYGGLDMAHMPGALRGPLYVYTVLSNNSYYALFLIPLLFPDGRFVPRWTGALVAVFALLGLFGSVAPGSLLDMSHWPAWLEGVSTVIAAVTVLFSPVYRFLRVSDAVQRQQTKWVVLGLVSSFGVFFLAGILGSAVPWVTASPPRAVLFGLLASTIVFGVLSLLPFCFAVAILRYRLWDIDIVLNRALVYLTLTVAAAGIYILVVAGIGALVRAEGSVLLSLLATALVAVLFHPLHLRVQRGVNRLLYGERDEPYAVLSRLARQLEGTPVPNAVMPSIVRTVAGALKLPYAALALQHGDDLTVVAATGTPSARSVRLPLLYQGESVGELILGTRAGEEGFSASDRRLLDDLARHAGVAAYAARLTVDLQHSRERLVTAREEERRRLRRDLHDGLGPSLASVTLMADAARNLLTHEPAAADALLRDLKREAQAATAEVRRVVYELRPPALDELGLVPALRASAGQYSYTGLHFSVEVPDDLPPLSAAVEVAAYRIAHEAMTNVVRHAGARSCTVSLWVDGDLHIEVADDGRGLRSEHRGVGLSSMRERAEELGGTCTVTPCPGGGTVVVASLPLGGMA